MRLVATALAICVAAGAAVADGVAPTNPDCVPAVRISGDRGAADEIRTNLAARGFDDDTTGGCPLIHARVEQRGDRLRVEVTDGYGRRSQREVGDTQTAIVLIESWARPEVVMDDLPGASIPAATPSLAEAPAPETPAGTALVASLASLPRLPAASGLAVVVGPVAGDDGSTWLGARVSGCRALGRACVGGGVGWARDLRVGDAAHSRSSTSAGLTTELSWPLGRVAIVPGVGLALAWDRMGEIGPHMDQHEDVASLRVAADLAVRTTLSGRWALVLELRGEDVVLGGAAAMPAAMGGVALGVRRGGW